METILIYLVHFTIIRTAIIQVVLKLDMAQDGYIAMIGIRGTMGGIELTKHATVFC
jgi:hypothetical protein